MTDNWIALSPIPQLLIDEDMKVDDFTIRKGISKECLKEEFDIDFDKENFNHIERELWISSPIYIRYFDANENEFFNKAQSHLFHFLNILVLFKPSKFYMPKRVLFVKRVKRTDGVNYTRDMTNDGRYPELLLEISNDEYGDFNSFFKICYPYFTKIPSNTIDDAILKSARTWLGKGRQTSSVFERIIFFSIILESLVEDRGFGSTERIQKRCASFLSNSQEEYSKIYYNVGKIYNIRSELIHGEVLKTTQFKETNELAEIIRCLLLQFITLSISDKYDRKTTMKESNVGFADKQNKVIFSDTKDLFNSRTKFQPLSE